MCLRASDILARLHATPSLSPSLVVLTVSGRCSLPGILVRLRRTWRGYRSRKYVHSFYAQKAYLEAVLEQNQEARAAARAHVAELETYLGHQELEEARSRFKASCDGKHHLVRDPTPGLFTRSFLPTAFVLQRERSSERPEPAEVTVISWNRFVWYGPSLIRDDLPSQHGLLMHDWQAPFHTGRWQC